MQNNGKGIFYGVIGVATLIVAIIGATFAFFTATNSNTAINGTAATSGLDLAVTLVSTDATGPMVPQLDAGIHSAIGATPSCVDGNGNVVCKVYSIVVTNTGSSAVVVDGTLTLAAATGAENAFANLKWSELATATTEKAGPVYNPAATTTLVEDVTLDAAGGANPSATYYVVVYINETTTSQNATDKGSFVGTVEFNSAAGGGVTSTFTA